uniref:Sepiapterin reductase n=1 Tax=Saccoglossus kowalevskii TaxID=10224 RepID=A0ABM0GYS6_SACKO|nr:PREDICTED: sepiapterin reductase-like [Saccoglossus kowalevskii]
MATCTGSVFDVPTFCLVTGASKGIGRGIAVALADTIGEGSIMVLVARSETGLQETKLLITSRRGGVEVRVYPSDLSDMISLRSQIECFFSDVIPANFQHAIVIHNAGSVGDVSKTLREFNEPVKLQSYFDFNVTSTICITSAFLTMFPKIDRLRRTVVNISSLCGIQPFNFHSLYCSSKAARDMLFKVLAAEEPDIRVVSYAPGPVNTDMRHEVEVALLTLGNTDMYTRLYTDLTAKGAVLTVEQTVGTLMKLLYEDSYDSGAHVDYYDVNK